MTSYAEQLSDKVRKSPLGPVTLNQAQVNVEAIDEMVRNEHFSDGQHNALEVPWVLGHIGSSTTGYLLDTAYGGTTIARPATGRATISVVSGVIGSVIGVAGTSVPAAVCLANPSGSDIDVYPQVMEVEVVSATSIEARLWRMTSTLGVAGNTWSLHAEAFDIAVYAQKQPVDVTGLGSHLTKVRRDFLTEQATDWSALVSNQGKVRKALSLEHVPDDTMSAYVGDHLVNRIAKASGLFIPTTGPAFGAQQSNGVGSVSRISAGVVEVTISGFTFGSTNLAACFCQAQQDGADELVIVTGRCHSTTKFRFYIYVYSVSENKWSRDDRAFYATMFGEPA